jgi:hypothetical protein
MKIKVLIIFCITVSCLSSYGQKQTIISSKKPLKDSTSQNGFFGGRLSTGIEGQIDAAKKIKSEGQAIIEDLGIKNIGIKASMLARRAAKKTPTKDEYAGIKTERRLGNYGSGTRNTLEEINVVKYVEDEAVSPYVSEIWWFDPAQSRIVTGSLKDNKSAQICHGFFRRIINQNTSEQGFFYMGAKDGRWETYGPEGELINKQYFKKGFPSGSNITYFDSEQKKIQAIIPIAYGKVRGQYRAFFASGNLQEEGMLDDSVRVGRWREFHEFGSGGRLKKEWRHGKDKFDLQEPVLIQERDAQGKIIYQQKNMIEE